MPLKANDGQYYTLKELGAMAKRARDATGDTQYTAAEHIGVEQSVVSSAESGASRHKQALFALIARYTPYVVNPEPHFQLVKKS